MHSNSFPELDAPGLKARPSKANPKRLYWVARSDLARAGYEPETVRLHYDISNPLDRRLIEQACKIHQSEMLAWAAGARSGAKPFDGTIASLIHQFQTHEASPYHDLKWNTRRNDDQVLRVLAKAIGKRSLASIGLTDLRRWYDEAKRPKAEGKPERIRKAHGIIKMLRRLFAFGKSAEIAGSARLVSILEETRFKQPPRRRAKLERHHVEAFIPVALTAGRLSLAIGTAVNSRR